MHGGRHSGIGAYVGVAAAAALAGACLAGGPLYVSSAASEAVQVGLTRTCLTDAGLTVRLARNPSGPESDLIAAAAATAHARPAIVTETIAQVLNQVGSTAPIRTYLLDRTGQYDEMDVAPLAVDEALAPDWSQPIFDIGPGTELTGTVPSLREGGEPTTVDLTLRDVYPGIPVNPEPSYWCGLRTLLRPTPQGDPPPPMLLVDTATFEGLPRLNVSRIVEVRPDPKGLTRTEAKHLSDELDAIATTYSNVATGAPSGGPVGIPIRGSRFRNGLPAIVAYAETLSEVVARTVEPVRIAGLAAAALLLVTAGAMLARARSSELRLRVLRGVSPVAVGARVAGGAAPAVALGMLGGFALAVVGVITLGPTPELEPGPVRDALVACALGALAGVVIVGAVIAVLSSRSVDARPRHHWLRWVPWELGIVALAVASYRRLDHAGGVRLVGAEAHGGDLLAQAFPLLALGAILAVLARPLRGLYTRSRRHGRSLPTALLLGVRRLGADGGISALATVAVGLVIGSITLSSTLTDSAEAMLHEKAGTFLGSGLVVSVNSSRGLELPASLASKSTIVQRARLDAAGTRVDLLGIDPSTFAATSGPRPSDRDVDALVRALSSSTDDGVPPAVIVHGALPTGVLTAVTHSSIEVGPVARADWFPGFRNGAVMVVVDSDSLESAPFGLAIEVWIHDAPADAVQQLRDSGWLVRGAQNVEDVFEVTSFLTVRWSYAVLTAFGVLIGVVVVVAQVLVLDARRRSRQAAAVVGRRMGIDLKKESGAIFVELAVPFVIGAVLGISAAVVIVHVAIGHLDTLRNLEPPAHVLVDVGSIATALAAGAVALLALAVLGSVLVSKIKPMEAMRSAE